MPRVQTLAPMLIVVELRMLLRSKHQVGIGYVLRKHVGEKNVSYMTAHAVFITTHGEEVVCIVVHCCTVLLLYRCTAVLARKLTKAGIQEP